MVNGDLSLQDGLGASTVPEAGVALAGAVGPGIKLINGVIEEV